VVDLESDYVELTEKVKANAGSLPDLKVADGFIYRKTEHLSGDPIHDNFC